MLNLKKLNWCLQKLIKQAVIWRFIFKTLRPAIASQKSNLILRADSTSTQLNIKWQLAKWSRHLVLFTREPTNVKPARMNTKRHSLPQLSLPNTFSLVLRLRWGLSSSAGSVVLRRYMLSQHHLQEITFNLRVSYGNFAGFALVWLCSHVSVGHKRNKPSN